MSGSLPAVAGPDMPRSTPCITVIWLLVAVLATACCVVGYTAPSDPNKKKAGACSRERSRDARAILKEVGDKGIAAVGGVLSGCS